MRIAHVSDTHFGRIAHADIVETVVHQVNDLAPDVVVVSGDLTQRARLSEWRPAARMLSSFEAPTLVIAGNHDTFAWWFPVRRLFTPLARYRQFVSAGLDPSLRVGNMFVQGIDSAYGWTVKGGWFTSAQIENVASRFRENGSADLRVLVVHHHLTDLSVFGRHDVAVRGSRLLEAARSSGVDLILNGHLHQSHVQVLTGKPWNIVQASAGTTTSDRGRRKDASRNYFNLIDVDLDGERMTVSEWLFDESACEFSPIRSTRFVRSAFGWGIEGDG